MKKPCDHVFDGGMCRQCGMDQSHVERQPKLQAEVAHAGATGLAPEKNRQSPIADSQGVDRRPYLPGVPKGALARVGRGIS